MNPQGRSILVLPLSNPETEKGIIVPKTAAKMKNDGTIVSHGDGCSEIIYDGAKIIYSPKSGSIITIDDVDHHFITEESVQYVYPKEV